MNQKSHSDWRTPVRLKEGLHSSCKRKKGSTDFGRTQRTALYDLYIIDRDKQNQVTTKPQITEQSPTRQEKLQKFKPKILGYRSRRHTPAYLTDQTEKSTAWPPNGIGSSAMGLLRSDR
jgi:hypothetical protein